MTTSSRLIVLVSAGLSFLSAEYPSHPLDPPGNQ